MTSLWRQHVSLSDPPGSSGTFCHEDDCWLMLCPVGVAVVSECRLVLHSHVKASGRWVPVAARRIRLLRTERTELDWSHLAL